MLDFIRRNNNFYLTLTLAAIALRLFFVFKFPIVSGDSLFYTEVAKNWLHHGIYGLIEDGSIVPTYLRLPGYPAFLAIVFRIFGDDHYRTVLLVQMLFDLGTCLGISALAQELWGDKTAKWAFALAALCPFLANYSAAILSETLSLWSITWAFLFFVRGLKRAQKRYWIGCGAATAFSILLRPDQGLLLFVFVTYLGWRWLRDRRLKFAVAALLVGSVAVAPLVPWTIRNWYVFHEFQPLVPRSSGPPGEFIPMGFNQWIVSWCADFTSTAEILWKVDVTVGEPLDISDLPNRAFDTPDQRIRTEKAIAAYNAALGITPAIDAQFAEIARERIAKSRFRYHVWLPFLRLSDMWLRPRVELLPIELRWWQWNDDLPENATVVVFGLLNIFYLAASAIGFFKFRAYQFTAVAFAFIVVRSWLLWTLGNPEPRYSLECYPVILVLAAAVLAHAPRTGWSDIRN